MAEHEQPTPEQLLEELRRFKVSDLLVSTFLTLSQLAYAKLDQASRDLDQARLAIDAMKALLPVLAGVVGDETKRDFEQVIANLQLAFASAVAGPAQEQPRAAASAAAGEEPAQGEGEAGPDEAAAQGADGEG